jgi:HEAT repeat protein
MFMMHLIVADDPCVKLAFGDQSVTDDCIAQEIKKLEVPAVSPAAIQRLSGLGKRSVSPLLQSLKNPKAEARGAAAEALGRIGSRAARTEDVVRALVVALADSEISVKRQVAGALGRIGLDVAGAGEVLAAAAKSDDEMLRIIATGALRGLTKPSPSPSVGAGQRPH